MRIYLHGQPSQFEEGGVFDQLYAPLKTVPPPLSLSFQRSQPCHDPMRPIHILVPPPSLCVLGTVALCRLTTLHALPWPGQVTGMQAIFDADDKLDKQREVIARDALNPKPLHQGGGMYVWERAVEAFHSLRRRVMPAR